MSCDLNLQNVLKESKSPYLRQHKDNPVHVRRPLPTMLTCSGRNGTTRRSNWQERLTDQSFSLRGILPVTGTSRLTLKAVTDSRCHVFAHESFENEEIAGLMNDHFINIKLDREERPDIDRIYMTYLQVSLWLQN